MKAQELVTNLQELHDELRINIQESQERYQRYQHSADKNRIPPPEFHVGDKAFVKAKFFRTTRPSKKLSEKYLGPFEIISQVPAHSGPIFGSSDPFGPERNKMLLNNLDDWYTWAIRLDHQYHKS